jgi:hypothetical protein
VPVTKLQAIWTGFTGAPGYSNFYFNGELTGAQCNTAAAAVRKLFADVVGTLPNIVKINVKPTATVHDTGGALTNTVAITTPGTEVTGSGGTAYAGGVGYVVHWLTGVYLNGRQLRGKTYFVPAVGAVMSSDGTMAPSFVTQVQTAANAYVATAGVVPVVWSNPPGPTGTSYSMNGATVQDRSAVMRSRRV